MQANPDWLRSDYSDDRGTSWVYWSHQAGCHTRNQMMGNGYFDPLLDLPIRMNRPRAIHNMDLVRLVAIDGVMQGHFVVRSTPEGKSIRLVVNSHGV